MGVKDHRPVFQTWVPKVLMMIITLGTVAWGRFSTNYFLSVGVSASAIGVLKSVGLISKCVSYTAWGVIADMSGRLKLTLMASILLATATLPLFRWPSVQASLHALVLVKLLRSVFNAVFVLGDSLTLALLKTSKSGRDEGYGKQRLWCSAAWGLGSLLIGMLIDRYGIDVLFAYSYWLMAVELAVIFYLVPDPSDLTSDGSGGSSNTIASSGTASAASPPRKSGGDASGSGSSKRGMSTKEFLAQARILVSNRQNLMFYSVLLCYGFLMSISENILMISLEVDYHTSRRFAGLVIAMSTSTELPAFFYSNALLRRWGVRGLLLRAMGATMLRLVCYACVTVNTVWLVAGVQLLHGASFAFMWVAAVSYASTVAPLGMEATSQALVSNLYATLGNGIGAVFWTLVFDHRGAQFVYMSGAVCVACLMACTHALVKLPTAQSVSLD